MAEIKIQGPAPRVGNTGEQPQTKQRSNEIEEFIGLGVIFSPDEQKSAKEAGYDLAKGDDALLFYHLGYGRLPDMPETPTIKPVSQEIHRAPLKPKVAPLTKSPTNLPLPE